jgi:hypothetical protein
VRVDVFILLLQPFINLYTLRKSVNFVVQRGFHGSWLFEGAYQGLEVKGFLISSGLVACLSPDYCLGPVFRNLNTWRNLIPVLDSCVKQELTAIRKLSH